MDSKRKYHLFFLFVRKCDFITGWRVASDASCSAVGGRPAFLQSLGGSARYEKFRCQGKRACAEPCRGMFAMLAGELVSPAFT